MRPRRRPAHPYHTCKPARSEPPLSRLSTTAVGIARAVLPKPVRQRMLDAIGRRKFKQSMITREGGLRAFARRTFTSRRPTLRHLDVHVTDHCNLGCKGCEHYSPLCEPWFADLSTTEHELRRLAELFEGIEQIYLLGGEPLLHPDVAAFVRLAREVFPGSRLCLMTNGMLVTRMDPEVWTAMSDAGAILLCDDYPIKLPKAEIDALAAGYGVQVEWMPPATEFFKASIDPAGSRDPERSFTACQWLSNCAIIRHGRLYPCAHIAYADAPARAFELPQLMPAESDSIDIFTARDGDAVIRFLTSPAPWCRFCDYENTETYTWERTSRKPDEWVSRQWLAEHRGADDES